MNVIIAQSGGPTSVINSSLAGVIKAAIDNDFDKIYLSMHGIEGVINNEIEEVDKEKFEEIGAKDKLMARPSSILGSCRYKLPADTNDDVYDKIFRTLRDYEITSFIYIGGNDSMDTVMKLNQLMDKTNIEGINIIGCPKTIDNDLEVMDHSPGFGSAAKYIATTLRSMRADVDIYDLKSVTTVEIMGRHAGWLAASSLVANHKMDKDVVNLVYLPEDDKSLDEIMDEIKTSLETESNLIVALAEGFRDRDGKLDDEKFSHAGDGFGHKVVAGVAERLSDIIRNELEIKSRAVELNIVQRVNTLTSATDAKEAYELGYRALLLSKENTNLIPILKRTSDDPYTAEYTQVEPDKIANHESLIPSAWLDNRKTLEKEMIAYTLPLIQGDIKTSTEDGLPVFVKLEEFIV